MSQAISWFSVAAFASLSVFSLPGIAMWLGIQTSVTWLLVLWTRSIRSAKRFGRLRDCPLGKLATELNESVKIANFLVAVVCSSQRTCSSASLMALISPVRIAMLLVRRAFSSMCINSSPAYIGRHLPTSVPCRHMVCLYIQSERWPYRMMAPASGFWNGLSTDATFAPSSSCLDDVWRQHCFVAATTLSGQGVKYSIEACSSINTGVETIRSHLAD